MDAPGMLYGVTDKGGHCCGWDGSKVYDPRGLVYPWAPPGYFHRFDFRLFCRFDKLA